ncbi:MAG: alpha/beta fold hydrolase [Bacteroidales bacterium]|nr:alpha/beta fold hydrolase [Bacteroidales bacterium]
MEQHRTLTVDGRTVHYRDEGRDNPHTLVLLHGYLQSLDVWSPYVITYMNHLRIITIDLPGHGFTDNFCDIHTMDFMARVVRSALVEVGINRCVMVGHSMGGYVALSFANQFPQSLCGLGLINSHAFADTPEHRQQREQICQDARANKAAHVVKTIPELFHDTNRAILSHEISDLQQQCLKTTTESVIAAQQGMAQRQSHIALLQSIPYPVLFVYGKNDNRIPLELAVSGAMIPPRSEIHLLDNVGHMAFLEAQSYVKPRLANFVHACYTR